MPLQGAAPPGILGGIGRALASFVMLSTLLSAAACGQEAPLPGTRAASATESPRPRYLDVKDLTGVLHSSEWRSNPPLDYGAPRPPRARPKGQRIEADILAAALIHAIDPDVWRDERHSVEIRNGILIVYSPEGTFEKIRKYLDALRDVELPPWIPESTDDR